jgi:hypothetical protein
MRVTSVNFCRVASAFFPLEQDIKPKNIFLTSKDCVRIGDLGCSKVLKQSLARTQIGTCPEQDGHTARRQCKWWHTIRW